MFLLFDNESMAVAHHIINANEFVEKFFETYIRLRDDSQWGHNIERVIFLAHQYRFGLKNTPTVIY